jgi:outer membrane protein assembly factor BamE (lipoprotein component of BamABCDE complex)
LCLVLALGIGCVDPSVVQEKARVFEAGLLDAIQEGRTTRQEVLLRLGTPSSTFEAGRILTYDFVVDQAGEWRRVGPSFQSGWSYPLPRTTSLVLVFGPDARLVRHNLVKELQRVEPSSSEPAASPQGQAL